jgi:hypothetical protein
LRGTATSGWLDYGVVTLCRHPWSENRVAIMAAGLHGPGTAAAVKLLSTENAFVDHPLGGVFNVSVPSEAPWEQRYHHLKPKLETHPYKVETYEASINDPKLDEMKFWNAQEVRGLLNVIRRKK